MQNFVQYTPTEVIFGKGTENQTGAEVKKWGGSRVLLVYGGGSAVRSGLIGRVEQSLKDISFKRHFILSGKEERGVVFLTDYRLDVLQDGGKYIVVDVGGHNGNSITSSDLCLFEYPGPRTLPLLDNT